MSRNISIRVAMAIVSMALVASASMSYYFYHRIHSMEITEAKKTLLQLAKTVQRTASIASYLDNMEIANDVLLGLAENEIIGAVTLTSKTGLSVRYGEAELESQGEYLVSLPLISPFTEGETVGELRIIPRQDRIETNARNAALEYVLLLAAYTVIVALIVLSSMQFLFVRALKNVANELSTIVPGESTSLESPYGHSRDEIGGLVQDINHLLRMVSEKLASERALRREVQTLERQFRIIFERAGVGIFILDDRGKMVIANKAFTELIGQGTSQMAQGANNVRIDDLFEDQDQVRPILRKTMTEDIIIEADLELKATDSTSKEQKWGHCLFNRIKDDHRAKGKDRIYVQGIISDISERKKREHELIFQAGHDPLTGLMNRRSVEQILNEMLKKSFFNSDCVALFLIDLDDFKPVNDTYGHDAGDKVLIETAKRMQILQHSNTVAARLGGDEFMLAMSGKINRKTVVPVAEQLLDCLIQPIAIDPDTWVKVGASVGIALSKEHGNDRSHLTAMADKALYHVKGQGKNNYWIELPPGDQ